MKKALTNYEECCDYLFHRPNYERTGRGVWKLDKMHRLLQALDNPQFKYKTIHVGGTNGKGSTASMISAILSANGANVGLHMSPHLLDFAERFKYNGVPAPHDWIVQKTQELVPIIEAIKPSFFEISIAMAFLYFAEMEVDWAVIEVGLGGRLDATNVLKPQAIAITNIGFDHIDKLGNTLAAIALEKAGIFKPQVPIFTTENQPAALAVLSEQAAKNNAAFYKVFPEKTWDIPLLGTHQQKNAQLAASLCWHLAIPEEVIEIGLKNVKSLSGLQGRLDLMAESPFIFIDVGHNVEGIQTALTYLSTTYPQGELSVLLGVMKDKDYPKVAQLLSNKVKQVYAVASNSPRALDAHILAAAMEAEGLRVTVTTVEEGILSFKRNAHSTDKLLICGSHYVAEVAFRSFLIENVPN